MFLGLSVQNSKILDASLKKWQWKDLSKVQMSYISLKNHCRSCKLFVLPHNLLRNAKTIFYWFILLKTIIILTQISIKWQHLYNPARYICVLQNDDVKQSCQPVAKNVVKFPLLLHLAEWRHKSWSRHNNALHDLGGVTMTTITKAIFK